MKSFFKISFRLIILDKIVKNIMDGTCTHICGKLQSRCGEYTHEGCNSSMRKSIEKGHIVCLRNALDKGKNPNKVYDYLWGEVPLCFAVKSRNIEMINLLIDYGANVNGVSKVDCDSIPLYGADYEFSKLLLEKGANPNIENDDGWTPLFRAVNSNKLDVVKLLLEHGANINRIDKNSDGVFDIWSSDETKLFLRKYISDTEELEIKQVDV